MFVQLDFAIFLPFWISRRLQITSSSTSEGSLAPIQVYLVSCQDPPARAREGLGNRNETTTIPEIIELGPGFVNTPVSFPDLERILAKEGDVILVEK